MDLLFIKTAFVALACGFSIGIERQLKGRPAGIRTSSLVCLGTSCFVYLGSNLGTDPAYSVRVISAVITGVGFLGAGVILNRRGHVKGVTSAAVIWSLATIGCFIGVGKFLDGVLMSALVLLLLVGVQAIETYFEKLRIGMYNHDVLHDKDTFKSFDEENHG